MRTPFEKNTQPVARTLSEANRDAQYACAIQTFKSDAKLTWNFIVDAVMGASIIGAGVLICYSVVKML